MGTFYELFEETLFDIDRPFAWAIAPSKIAQLIKRMGSTDPSLRPSALQLIELFNATKLAANHDADRPRRFEDSYGRCTVS